MTEAEFEGCIRRICAGDKGGLKEIYEAYLPYLYSIIFGVLQNKENAEDVTSDFFIKLWTRAEEYKPGSGHKGYLATIARNMAIDFIRKHKKEILVEGFEEDKSGEDSSVVIAEAGGAQSDGALTAAGNGTAMSGNGRGSGTESEVENSVISNVTLQQALDKLKPEEREIIHLKVMGDLTFKEIAAILELPIGTVTWRYQEGIKKLRRYGYE